MNSFDFNITGKGKTQRKRERRLLMKPTVSYMSPQCYELLSELERRDKDGVANTDS